MTPEQIRARDQYRDDQAMLTTHVWIARQQLNQALELVENGVKLTAVSRERMKTVAEWAQEILADEIKE